MTRDAKTSNEVGQQSGPTSARVSAAGDDGGDPACWASLFEEEISPPSSEDLAHLVHELADAVIICDPDGRITLWNSAAERIFGWTSNEALGQSLDIIIPERLRKRHWDGYFDVMRTGTTSYAERLLEVPALHRDGSTISIAFTVSLLRTEGSTRPRGIAAVIRDDTDRRRELLETRNASANAQR